MPPTPHNAALNINKHTLAWLWIGILALSCSGIFSIVVAVAWHPSVKSVEIFATLFKRSLIAHVNLSITVWFLCGLFMLWSHNRTDKPIIPYAHSYARFMMILGIALMTAATFDSSAIPLLNNYIPTLQHPLFYLSLGCIFICVMVECMAYLGCYISRKHHDLLTLNNHISHLVLLIAIAAFIASGALIEPYITGTDYYEILFWGGGHVMQFVWVQVMLACWIILLSALNPSLTFHRGYRYIFYANLLAVLSTPIPYFMHEVSSGDFRQLFTLLMAWVSGIAPVLFVCIYAYDHLTKRQPLGFRYRHAYGATLWWSLILFSIGGAFAVMIDGLNVKIPAHYHGSLLGITMALMGLTYYVLAEHGYEYIKRTRLTIWQSSLLGIGQIMHIGGLFWLGGYGVQRKSPDMTGEAMQQADLALRIQSSGGGIAIIGGLMFVIICIRAWSKGRTPSN